MSELNPEGVLSCYSLLDIDKKPTQYDTCIQDKE